mmetsp:Transcript_6921/g.25503  ORF Transcript_6921/g.25503 Transcript_6921/m.25503 type:complete len:477 (-) Transcript_6921:35-1465(-)
MSALRYHQQCSVRLLAGQHADATLKDSFKLAQKCRGQWLACRTSLSSGSSQLFARATSRFVRPPSLVTAVEPWLSGSVPRAPRYVVQACSHTTFSSLYNQFSEYASSSFPTALGKANRPHNEHQAADNTLGGRASGGKHLVVLVNGLMGTRLNWTFFSKLLQQSSDSVSVHQSRSNELAKTFHGIDSAGERLADEINSLVESARRDGIHYSRISLVGHSLGGLIARYAAGCLFEERDSVGLIAGLKPAHFMTFSTPHLGSTAQVPFTGWLGVKDSMVASLAPLVVRRTGEQLFLRDNPVEPLLLKLSKDSPTSGPRYLSALRSFSQRTLYCNVDSDHIVGWHTSAIRPLDAEPPGPLSPSKRYPHIIWEEDAVAALPKQKESSNVQVMPKRVMPLTADMENDPSLRMYHEAMIRRLSDNVEWRRVHVSFKNTFIPVMAHNHIQVSRRAINMVGKDVVEHAVENLVKETSSRTRMCT